MFGEVHAYIGHAGERTRLPRALQEEAGIHNRNLVRIWGYWTIPYTCLPQHHAWCTEGPPLIFVDWHASEGSWCKDPEISTKELGLIGDQFGYNVNQEEGDISCCPWRWGWSQGWQVQMAWPTEYLALPIRNLLVWTQAWELLLGRVAIIGILYAAKEILSSLRTSFFMDLFCSGNILSSL